MYSIISGSEVVEVAIGIELFAGELAGVIARPGFVTDSVEDIVRITGAGVLVVIGQDDVTPNELEGAYLP